MNQCCCNLNQFDEIDQSLYTFIYNIEILKILGRIQFLTIRGFFHKGSIEPIDFENRP